MATLGRHFTLELTLKPKHQLITAPPYNIVRHPSYTGGMMASLGAALAFYTPVDGWFRSVWLAQLRSSDWPLSQRALAWGVTVFMGAIFTLGTVTGISRTTAEDRMLRERFGKEWDRWATSTPYKLFPFIY
jgi:protein-S-isoprenylcysteine O-methyltransferase Ste14